MKSPSTVEHRVGTREARSLVAPRKEEETKNVPTLEEIRKRAFEIHIEGGGIYGRDLEDWLLAEHELKEKRKNNGQGAKEK
jgi:DUF2934 family protein